MVSLAGIAFRARAEGKHHHDGGDAKHTRDDGETDAHAVLAAVQEGVEKTHEHTTFALEGDLLLVTAGFVADRSVEFGIGFQAGTLHQTGGDNAADDGSCHTHQSSLAEAQTGHEGNHHETHAKSGTEVGQRHQLVFLEVAVEVLVVSQGDDGGVVAQEGHDGTQGGHTRQVVEGLHQGTEQIFQQTHHAKLGEQLADGSHKNADGHDVEHGLQQQVVGSLHEGVQHVGQGHLVGKETEESKEHNQEEESLHASFGGEPQGTLQFLFNLLKDLFHSIVIG